MAEELNSLIVNLIQYGGISALAIYLMYRITHNALEEFSNEIRELRTEISKLRESIEELIRRLGK
jgi:F0F1-type ATP synthase membrane subunit b/b'